VFGGRYGLMWAPNLAPLITEKINGTASDSLFTEMHRIRDMRACLADGKRFFLEQTSKELVRYASGRKPGYPVIDLEVDPSHVHMLYVVGPQSPNQGNQYLL
jgi:hypothetical protein